MSDVKLFRRENQDFSYKDYLPANQEPYSILAFANASNSDTMSGGFLCSFLIQANIYLIRE